MKVLLFRGWSERARLQQTPARQTTTAYVVVDGRVFRPLGGEEVRWEFGERPEREGTVAQRCAEFRIRSFSANDLLAGLYRYSQSHAVETG
jgi:hypothetical protein